MSSSHGWAHVDLARKREIVAAIRDGGTTPGPVHAELDLTDRCNVACYFCNQMDVRTTVQMPLERVKALLGELVAGGLRSVRLSGGGDPLAYRHVTEVLDLLAEERVVVDNLTTNGALLGPEIARRLVEHACREVIVSLNAASAADYARMMRVKPAIFEQVVASIRGLLERRGGQRYPVVTVQFLIDQENFGDLPRMYELGRELRVDRIAVNAVLEIPYERIDKPLRLDAPDLPRVRPHLEEILSADRDDKRLFLLFPWPSWNEAVAEIEAELQSPSADPFPLASSFREEDGACFFGWYSATVRATGEMYPCCMLLNPTYTPIGNAQEGFASQWRGEGFDRLRWEMRELLLTKGRMLGLRRRFKALTPACYEPGRCALKNMYFRGDEMFYRELGAALDEARRNEVRWLGGRAPLRRALEVLAFRIYHGVRVRCIEGFKRWRRALRRQRRALGGGSAGGALVREMPPQEGEHLPDDVA